MEKDIEEILRKIERPIESKKEDIVSERDEKDNKQFNKDQIDKKLISAFIAGSILTYIAIKFLGEDIDIFSEEK